MVVRFSCFSTNIYSQRPKQTVQSSVEEMRKSLQNFSEIQAIKHLPNSGNTKAILSSAPRDTLSNDDIKYAVSSSSTERCSKSDEIKGMLSLEKDIHRLGRLKKSQSLGNRLCWEGRYPGETDVEEETDQGFSSDSHDQHGEMGQDGSNDPIISLPNECQKAPHSESVQISSDHANNECVFSIGEPQNSDKEGGGSPDAMLFGVGDCAVNYIDNMPHNQPLIVKSRSLPNINAAVCPSIEWYTINHLILSSRSSDDLKVLGMRQKSYTINHLVPHSRSSDDLKVLGTRQKDISIHRVDTLGMQEKERDDDICKTVKNKFGIQYNDCYDSCNYSASAIDWLIPDENSFKNFEGKSSAQHWDQLPSKDFKIKRIEEWVNDLQHCSPLEETSEISLSNDQLKRETDVLNGFTAFKEDGKATAGMETAKRYISSLSATATTAQLSNHGLVAIPFLSAFISLKVLNLSGNAIVRITAGALPRGLHMLNLSKNNISTIEGLRKLTCLRVLDLSYNRIFRIGHGLASCSSLKELYLAGNKISEVEGLHRLLKLTVLDLRFNKISTAKCLGQLAANYNSLQAVSMEGNPAQKNVGDEQLKKYLQGLLPHLFYFNRQPTKASTMKDASDRSVRLGISAHQFDRGLRSDNKATRKSSHGIASHGHSLSHGRRSSSSTYGRKSQRAVSPPKRSRGGHMHLPRSGIKATTNYRHNYFDIGSKFLNFKSEFSMRRSQSEGMLGGP